METYSRLICTNQTVSKSPLVGPDSVHALSHGSVGEAIRRVHNRGHSCTFTAVHQAAVTSRLESGCPTESTKTLKISRAPDSEPRGYGVEARSTDTASVNKWSTIEPWPILHLRVRWRLDSRFAGLPRQDAGPIWFSRVIGNF